MTEKQDPLWYKNAVFYQINVKCFHDSDGNGIGDFLGLTKKLDYIQNLGCTAIWIQPFYPSPLKDDGYDIQDYYDIHPDYGTLKDFKIFLKEAHKRNIKVVTELVINHTSDQNEWFQKSRRAKKGSKWHNYYVWSDDPERYADARIIFKDFETSNWKWDPVAKAYYWHRFYSCQPDLNYDNLEVHEEIFKIVDFWMKMGVDGMRLDAIPYLYQREGTDCENLPETHAFLKKLRKHVDDNFEGRMLLAEANQWPDQASAYFGDEDQCQMAFHFPVMPRLFMAIQMEDRFPIVDIMEQTPLAAPTCQWAMFLRNHDELTLEMVTDEERDYMYRCYAKDPKARINLGIRRRLAPLLENNRQKIELLFILLFSMPGSPIIYYGDEIGMGDNYYLGDRNGVRTPMQWNYNSNAGFSNANPQKLYLPLIIDPEYHHDYLNVENQEQTASSQLRWVRRAISVRHQYQAFGCGSFKFLHPSNPKVLVFLREHEGTIILVATNLSRYAQYVECDLSEYAGCKVKDLFSGNEFSQVKDGLYGLTLGPYGYYWLSIEKVMEDGAHGEVKSVPEMTIKGDWHEVLKGADKSYLEKTVLPAYIPKCRWFRAKARKIKKVKILEQYTIGDAKLLVMNITTDDEQSSVYLIPVVFSPLEQALQTMERYPIASIARLLGHDEDGYLIDAIYDARFREKLLQKVLTRAVGKGSEGIIKFHPESNLKRVVKEVEGEMTSSVIKAEQSNSSIIYGDKIILKMYRLLEEGVNPDVELTKYLSEESTFSNTPAYYGCIEQVYDKKNYVVATLQEYIPNSGDAWSYTLDSLKLFFENAISNQSKIDTYKSLCSGISDWHIEAIPEDLRQLIGYMYLETVALLGRRTAEMHAALLQNGHNPAMATEPFTPFYQKSICQGVRGRIRKVFSILKDKIPTLEEHDQKKAREVLALEKKALSMISNIVDENFGIKKFRIHSDFHLGQVLYTGTDLFIFDFEGEPILPISERRLKRSALVDIAGMIRSFHYAVTTSLYQQKNLRTEIYEKLEPFADLWFDCVKKVFLNAYLDVAKEHKGLVPADETKLNILLKVFLLNKAVYEVGYELQNRPDWISIPLNGLLNILEE